MAGSYISLHSLLKPTIHSVRVPEIAAVGIECFIKDDWLTENLSDFGTFCWFSHNLLVQISRTKQPPLYF